MSLSVSVWVLVAALSQAQLLKVPAQTNSEPKTKLGAFLAREGVLISERRATIGEMVGSNGAALIIDSVSAWEVGRESVVTRGADFKISQGTKGSSSVLLDADEMGGLLKAIDQMRAMIASASRPAADTSRPQADEEISMIYATKGGFAFTAYGGPKGFGVMGIIDSEIPTRSVIFDSKVLDQLQSTVRTAVLATQAK